MRPASARIITLPLLRAFPARIDMAEKMKYTRFEKARIIGARALQISMGAPVLIELPTAMIDPVNIATFEYNEDAIPITVRRD
jgi:DNA-directed RNA polymerase subunit K